MPSKTVFNCATGIQTVVELTAEEIAADEAFAADEEVRHEAREAELAAVAAHKASGEAKLADLGLSVDEIAALVG